jgi:DnaJ domain
LHNAIYPALNLYGQKGGEEKAMFPKYSEGAPRSLVLLQLAEGKKLIASLRLSVSGKLSDTLNNAEPFLDVITGDGEQAFVRKQAVERVIVVDPPQAKLNQQRRSSDKAGFNPYAILGVERTASSEDHRAAYLALVKSYHPDRFANLDLPQEMKDYVSAMLTRINMAYEQISS